MLCPPSFCRHFVVFHVVSMFFLLSSGTADAKGAIKGNAKQPKLQNHKFRNRRDEFKMLIPNLAWLQFVYKILQLLGCYAWIFSKGQSRYFVNDYAHGLSLVFSWPIGPESSKPQESLQELSQGPAPDSLERHEESHVSITGLWVYSVFLVLSQYVWAILASISAFWLVRTPSLPFSRPIGPSPASSWRLSKAACILVSGQPSSGPMPQILRSKTVHLSRRTAMNPQLCQPEMPDLQLIVANRKSTTTTRTVSISRAFSIITTPIGLMRSMWRRIMCISMSTTIITMATPGRGARTAVAMRKCPNPVRMSMSKVAATRCSGFLRTPRSGTCCIMQLNGTCKECRQLKSSLFL